MSWSRRTSKIGFLADFFYEFEKSESLRECVRNISPKELVISPYLHNYLNLLEFDQEEEDDEFWFFLEKGDPRTIERCFSDQEIREKLVSEEDQLDEKRTFRNLRNILGNIPALLTLKKLYLSKFKAEEINLDLDDEQAGLEFASYLGQALGLHLHHGEFENYDFIKSFALFADQEKELWTYLDQGLRTILRVSAPEIGTKINSFYFYVTKYFDPTIIQGLSTYMIDVSVIETKRFYQTYGQSIFGQAFYIVGILMKSLEVDEQYSDQDYRDLKRIYDKSKYVFETTTFEKIEPLK